MIQNHRGNVVHPSLNVIAIAGVLVAAIGAWQLGWLGNLFTTGGFIPHGHCYLWQPDLVWLHIGSDLLIGAAYVSISTTLAYLVRRTRREIPFHWMFLAFGLFIIACGATHFIEILTLWQPLYWLSGNVKLLTAIASVTTALALPPLVPQVHRLLQAARTSEERRQKLETANQELETLYQTVKQLDAAKTQFFANVSHELRTPLALILGPIEHLLHSSDLTPAQQQSLEVVDRNARSLLGLVNDLLDVSKLEMGQMQLDYHEVDLVRLVRVTTASFETVATDRTIDFLVETPASLTAQVDAERLQRVFLNLLSNAFKFTPQGGRVVCSLSPVADETDATGKTGETNETGAIANPPQRVRFTIQDSGPGVPPDLRETVFERFYSKPSRALSAFGKSAFGSTGLGLSIVRDLVTLHQGTVQVTDAAIGGACFVVELPVMAPSGTWVESEALPLPEVEPFARTGSKEIATVSRVPVTTHQNAPNPNTLDSHTSDRKPLVLVVEDNPDMNWFIQQTLSSEYRIATASDGQQGLEQAIALHPDLILSDMMMPRMDGEEMVQQIRQQPYLADVPIILLTAKSDRALEVALLRQGVQDYLTKPFSSDELQARVNNLVTMQQARQVLQKELTSQGKNVAELASSLAQRQQELQMTLQALQNSETRFRRAVLDSPFPIAIHAEDGEIVTISHTWTELTGYTHADIPTIADWTERAYGERKGLVQADIDRLYNLDRRLEEGEYTVITVTGEPRIWDFSSAPLGQLPDGRRLVISMARDVTDRKQLEKTLRQQAEELAQMNRMKDEFLATLSHELRTPLNSILGWAKLLQTRSFDATTTTRALDTIERNARAQSQLIEDLLEISRIIQGKLRLQPQPIALLPVVEAALESVRPTAEAKAILLAVVPESTLNPLDLHLMGDADRLQQVVWNLLSNAIKFTPDGGKVTVGLSVMPGHSALESSPQWVDRGLSEQNLFEQDSSPHPLHYARITVTDTGIGMAPELLPHVFDRFRQGDSSVTRSYSGLGLGLAIARHLVELHGGTVQAESLGLGQGATFTVLLPLLPSPPAPPSPPLDLDLAVSSTLPLAGLQAIVLDDDPDTREYVETVLTEYGMTVTTFATAKDVLQQGLLNPKREQPDILISDIGMPDEDGYSFIRQVRQLEPSQGSQVPAIALTAYAGAEDEQQAILAGFQLHLAKPVAPLKLVAAVAMLTGRSSAIDQGKEEVG